MKTFVKINQLYEINIAHIEQQLYLCQHMNYNYEYLFFKHI